MKPKEVAGCIWIAIRLIPPVAVVFGGVWIMGGIQDEIIAGGYPWCGWPLMAIVGVATVVIAALIGMALFPDKKK